MKKIKINLPINIGHGVLLWIDSVSKKMYYSSHRYDITEFIDHESNYLGEFNDLFPTGEQQNAVVDLLEHGERVFGICLNTEGGQVDQHVSEVCFFPSWDRMLKFANQYFEEFDASESERLEEVSRRSSAKKEWLKSGRRFISSESTTRK
ncbi:MAG TPA: hypothetical protein VK044_07940 [Virgibacillus sp.]|nr:hypothetical protein [Virgibacillus sp.]